MNQQSMEKILRKYFKDVVRLESLIKKENLLRDQIIIMTNELDVLKRLYGYSTSCRWVPLKVHFGNSDLSDKLTQQEDMISRYAMDLTQKHRQLISIQMRIFSIREFVDPLDVYIGRLNEEELQLIEYRYFYRMSNYTIADMLHCSEKRVRRMKEQIIDNIADWVGEKRRKNAASVSNNCVKLVS